MSLLKRVERAQRGPGDPSDSALVPVAPAAPGTSPRPRTGRADRGHPAEAAARGHRRVQRPRGCEARGHRRQDGGDRRPGNHRGRPCGHRRGAPEARGPDDPRRHRLRPDRAVPQGRDHHRGHGQRAEPDLHRTGRQARARRHELPQRRARAAGDRPDHHPDGPSHRRDEPTGRRPPPRRVPRQRDHRPALVGWTGHHGPQVLAYAVHGEGPDPLRDRDTADVPVPQVVHRGAPEHLRLGWHGLGQDHRR